MPQLKVDEIAESTVGGGIELKNNTSMDGATTLTTGTGLTTAGGNLQVDGNTSLNGSTSLNDNAITDVTALTASGLVTCGGVNAGSGTIQTTGTASTGALTCTSLTVGTTPFAVNLKAFGVLTFTSDSNDNPTVATGDYNITNSTHNAGSNTIVINFTTSMAGANYIPLITLSHDHTRLFGLTSISKSTTALTLVYDQRTYAGATDSQAIDMTVNIAVLEL